MLIDSNGFLKRMEIKSHWIIVGYGLVFLVLTICILSPRFSYAGDEGYMVTKDNETILDEKEGNAITWQNRIWFTGKNVRVENTQDKNRVLLIDMEKGKIFQLNNQEKTYQIIDFPEGLQDLYSEGDLKSQRIDQTKKCGEWECYGVKISTKNKDIALDTEYWMAKDVVIPLDLRMKIARYFGPDQVRLTEELGKYEGYPVQTVLTMNVNDKTIKMVSNVVVTKKLEIDPEIFKIPSDFKIVNISMEKRPDEKEERDANTNTKDPNMKEEKPGNP
ncbi:MAG: DUF4412 domain-containing protein [bacterium]